VIRLRQVGFEYPNRTAALSDVNLDIEPGRLTAIIGPNGSGKSTLARLLLGLLIPSTGTVEVEGLDTSTADPAVLRRLVGLAWQNPDNQLVCGVVEDDVAFGPENLGLPAHEVDDRVDFVLEILNLSDLRFRSIQTLTLAQKQVVAVAGVMALRPRYLVLDEVTSRLDPAAAQDLLASVGRWARQYDAGVVMVTHRLTEILPADAVCRLEPTQAGGGRVAAFAKPDEVLREARHDPDSGLESPLFDIVLTLEDLGVDLPPNVATPEEVVEALCH